MRKFITAATALLLACLLHAEESTSSYSISADFTYTSKYYFRGLKNQDAAFQPSVTFTQGALSLGIWSSQALSDKSAAWAQGNEVDFSGSYTWALNEKVSFNLLGTLYYYPSARPSLDEADKSYEMTATLTAPVGPLSGSLALSHDFGVDSKTIELGLTYSVPLSSQAVSLDLNAVYGYTDIADANGSLPGSSGVSYGYYCLHATTGYKFSDKATGKLGVHWTDVSGIDSASDNVWFTAGLTVGF